MTVLETKIQQLIDRRNMLESSIQELKEAITEEGGELAIRNIERDALEINNLETQLELTELAIQNTQDKLRARIELENSKQYKDKQKMQEKLSGEAEKQAMSIFEKVNDLLAEIQEVEEKVNKADTLFIQLAGNQAQAQHYIQHSKQPFNWLWKLSRELQMKVAEMKTMKERGAF